MKLGSVVWLDSCYCCCDDCVCFVYEYELTKQTHFNIKNIITCPIVYSLQSRNQNFELTHITTIHPFSSWIIIHHQNPLFLSSIINLPLASLLSLSQLLTQIRFLALSHHSLFLFLTLVVFYLNCYGVKFIFLFLFWNFIAGLVRILWGTISLMVPQVVELAFYLFFFFFPSIYTPQISVFPTHYWCYCKVSKFVFFINGLLVSRFYFLFFLWFAESC